MLHLLIGGLGQSGDLSKHPMVANVLPEVANARQVKPYFFDGVEYVL